MKRVLVAVPEGVEVFYVQNRHLDRPYLVDLDAVERIEFERRPARPVALYGMPLFPAKVATEDLL